MLPNHQPTNLWRVLQRSSDQYPSKGVLFRDNVLESDPSRMTWEALLHLAARDGEALRPQYLAKPGGITLLCFESHKDNIIWTWSVIAAGGVPAVMTPISKHKQLSQAELGYLGE